MRTATGWKRHGKFKGNRDHVGTGMPGVTSRFDTPTFAKYGPDGDCHFGDPCDAPAVADKRFCAEHLALLHRIRDELDAEEADRIVPQHAILRQYDRQAGGWVNRRAARNARHVA